MATTSRQYFLSQATGVSKVVRLGALSSLDILALVGCTNPLQVVLHNSTPPPPRNEYQRFVPIPVRQNVIGAPWIGSVALDAKTGQTLQRLINLKKPHSCYLFAQTYTYLTPE